MVSEVGRQCPDGDSRMQVLCKRGDRKTGVQRGKVVDGRTGQKDSVERDKQH